MRVSRPLLHTERELFTVRIGVAIILDSEKFTGQRKLTKKGDGEYRRLIFNAARAAGRFGFRPHLDRFRNRGMKSTEAYVALGRELIRIAFALIKNREQSDPNRLKIA